MTKTSPDALDDELARARARIVELEVRYTEQDAMLRALSDVLYRQQQTIDAMNARVASLERRLVDVGGPDAPPAPEDEVPPHY